MSFICFYVTVFIDHHLVPLLYKFLSSGFKRSWRDTVLAFYHNQMLPHGIHFTSHNLPDVPKPTFLFWSFCREPGDNQQHKLAQTIGIPMCQALIEYDEGNYNRAFGLLYPLRYHMVDIGGSDAQVKSAGKKLSHRMVYTNFFFLFRWKFWNPGALQWIALIILWHALLNKIEISVVKWAKGEHCCV